MGRAHGVPHHIDSAIIKMHAVGNQFNEEAFQRGGIDKGSSRAGVTVMQLGHGIEQVGGSNRHPHFGGTVNDGQGGVKVCVGVPQRRHHVVGGADPKQPIHVCGFRRKRDGFEPAATGFSHPLEQLGITRNDGSWVLRAAAHAVHEGPLHVHAVDLAFVGEVRKQRCLFHQMVTRRGHQ